MSDSPISLFDGVAKGVTKSLSTERATAGGGLGVDRGKILSNVALTTSNSTVAHGLGRVPTGVIIVGATAAESIAVVSMNKSSLVLKASGSATFKLLVF